VVVAVGVDACRTGWIAVAVDDTGVLGAHYLPAISTLATAVAEAEVVGIDIPIGMPESGRREADVAARALLGPRRNSVFFTPPRPVVEASAHAEASAVSLRLTGFGISRQAFALAPKLLEVDEWIRRAPCPVYEVHPEVSFALLIGSPATASKHSWAGVSERRTALDSAGLNLDGVDGEAARRAGVDDMLDAAAAAWTARRIAHGHAVAIPESAPIDTNGRPIAIWA
jgi:predicted RNase H-like nuclease